MVDRERKRPENDFGDQSQKRPKVAAESPQAKPLSIYIVPDRIQRKRLQILRDCGKRHGFVVVAEFNDEVTHVLTEYTTKDQVAKAILASSPQHSSNITSSKILTCQWLIDSVKNGLPITGKDEQQKYEIPDGACMTASPDSHSAVQPLEPAEEVRPSYACMRKAPLNHHNMELVEALSVMVKYAEYRDDEPRALAFAKSIAALKSLSFTVVDAKQLDNVADVGKHSIRIIKDILKTGKSQEVEETANSEWFRAMEAFNGIYGVGPARAKKLFDSGFRSVGSLKEAYETLTIKDNRILHGLAFYDDLVTPVKLADAQKTLSIISEHAQELLPGITMTLTGGFRRGKSEGHDVDILFTHSEEGLEIGFLAKLYDRLMCRGLVLHGRYMEGSQNEHQRRNTTMDSFEKYFLIFICPTGDEKARDDHYKPVSESEPTFRDLCAIAASPRNWKAVRVDLIMCPASQYAYALVGWTGNRHFNRSLRDYANKVLNMRLTSHGLWDVKNRVMVPAVSEVDVFSQLKLTYREPCERNA